VFATKIKLTIHDRRGSAKGVFEMVYRQPAIFAIMLEDDGRSVATRYVNAPSSPHWRRKDEIIYALKSQRFAPWFAGHGIKPGKDILIVPEKIKGVVVEQRRGHVWR
jgi:hypothetical protein